MNFIYEPDLSLGVLAKLVFGVHQQQASFGSLLLPVGKQLQGRSADLQRAEQRSFWQSLQLYRPRSCVQRLTCVLLIGQASWKEGSCSLHSLNTGSCELCKPAA